MEIDLACHCCLSGILTQEGRQEFEMRHSPDWDSLSHSLLQDDDEGQKCENAKYGDAEDNVGNVTQAATAVYCWQT